jgi:ribosome maturation factor RimP
VVNGSAARDQVADLLTPVLGDVGLDLEGVDLIPAGRRTVLRVVVDGDGGVTLDQLAETSRMVGKVLDSTDIMGARPYTLEVTSRGVDRPLTAPRHWRRNIGRLVRVVHHDGSELTGRVTGAAEDTADLDVDGHIHHVGYSAVAKARVQVEFSRLPSQGEDADVETADGVANTDRNTDTGTGADSSDADGEG